MRQYQPITFFADRVPCIMTVPSFDHADLKKVRHWFTPSFLKTDWLGEPTNIVETPDGIFELFNGFTGNVFAVPSDLQE